MKPVKRHRSPTPEDASRVETSTQARSRKNGAMDSLHREVSPPQLKRSRIRKCSNNQEAFSTTTGAIAEPPLNNDADNSGNPSKGLGRRALRDDSTNSADAAMRAVRKSPFRLTRIRDLPSECNIDTVGINDLLGDPLIKEAWLLDYLFDIDWLMQAFDPDVRSMVQVKVVHGSWRQDDTHRLRLVEAATRFPNIQLVTAHMPEAFGTHHSKMMILLRHDDTAEVIIHTANMIRQDWTNMTQGVWTSNRLPLLTVYPDVNTEDNQLAEEKLLGSGQKFKLDLLQYLSAYEGRTRSLRSQLQHYDFSSVRAALIASVPGRQKIYNEGIHETMWGWPALSQHLARIPCSPSGLENKPSLVVAQVSSIATLSEKWIQSFSSTLTSCVETREDEASAGLPQCSPPLNPARRARVSIVFPTEEEVRTSLDGYAAGGSIHMKVQSATQQKQLSILRPIFCRWAGDASETHRTATDVSGRHGLASTGSTRPSSSGDALRTAAAPHIKTYIRYRDDTFDEIQWALLTSANLSTQAWGSFPTMPDKAFAAKTSTTQQSVRICSYEIGVLVWPALFQSEEFAGQTVAIRPVFGRDTPVAEASGMRTVVPLRMPYSLPLTPYTSADIAWCATLPHFTPDSHGCTSMP